jgi:NADPH:quinone reductase-like Zn-dependent oxidoreductase
MRAVQITHFGGPEVLDVVDLPDPVAGDGQQLYEVSAAGVNFADTHHALSWCPPRRQAWGRQRPTT